jgi:tRNA(Ile)-lysidine synthase
MKPVARAHGLEILRPMLGIVRDEITAFVTARRIPYRDDRSNADVSHTRNMLRNRTIPEIKRAFGDSFGPAILRASEILREEESWMASLVPEVGDALSCATLRSMPIALRRRVILRWLRRARIEEVGFAETSLVLTLLDVRNGPAKVNLPGDRHARRRTGTIFLE